MDIIICGMSLEEVEANFEEFEKIRNESMEAYQKVKYLGVPKPDTFMPKEENEFVHKIYDDVRKVFNDLMSHGVGAMALGDIDESKMTDEEKDLHATYKRVEKIRDECSNVILEENRIEQNKKIKDENIHGRPIEPKKRDGE